MPSIPPFIASSPSWYTESDLTCGLISPAPSFSIGLFLPQSFSREQLEGSAVISIWFAGSLVKCTVRGWQMDVHMNFNSTNCWENILILDYNNHFRLSWHCFLIISSFISHKNVHSLGCEFYGTSLWSHNKSLINQLRNSPDYGHGKDSANKTWENRLYFYCALVIRGSAEEKLDERTFHQKRLLHSLTG